MKTKAKRTSVVQQLRDEVARLQIQVADARTREEAAVAQKQEAVNRMHRWGMGAAVPHPTDQRITELKLRLDQAALDRCPRKDLMINDILQELARDMRDKFVPHADDRDRFVVHELEHLVYLGGRYGGLMLAHDTRGWTLRLGGDKYSSTSFCTVVQQAHDAVIGKP